MPTKERDYHDIVSLQKCLTGKNCIHNMTQAQLSQLKKESDIHAQVIMAIFNEIEAP